MVTFCQYLRTLRSLVVPPSGIIYGGRKYKKTSMFFFIGYLVLFEDQFSLFVVKIKTGSFFKKKKKDVL